MLSSLILCILLIILNLLTQSVDLILQIRVFGREFVVLFRKFLDRLIDAVYVYFLNFYIFKL